MSRFEEIGLRWQIHLAHVVRYRSMQYSVWYITQENSSNSSPTVVYEPFHEIIPHDMDYMREHIRLPITSHNRAW